MEFLDNGKTERECIDTIVNTIEKAGYVELNKAIAEGHRQSEIQKRKAEEVAKTEKAAVQPTPNTEVPTEDDETPRMWISFKAYLSVDDAQALKSFFETRNIDFAAI